MKFEKIQNGDKCEHFINDKPVDENTYNILLKDDSVNSLSAPAKISESMYRDMEFGVTECECGQCEEIREIVSTLQELDFDDAVEFLSEYIDVVRGQEYNTAVGSLFSELGQQFLKEAGKAEMIANEFGYSDYDDEVD